MKNFIEKLKSQPEPVRKKIFIAAMAVIFIAVFSLYIFTIKDSIENSVSKNTAERDGLIGEFALPSIKDSVGAAFKDIFN